MYVIESNLLKNDQNRGVKHVQNSGRTIIETYKKGVQPETTTVFFYSSLWTTYIEKCRHCI